MILSRLKRFWCDHEWGPWLYGYPTPDSVAQYSTCEKCGKRRRNWIERPREDFVSERKKKEREREPTR